MDKDNDSHDQANGQPEEETTHLTPAQAIEKGLIPGSLWGFEYPRDEHPLGPLEHLATDDVDGAVMVRCTQMPKPNAEQLVNSILELITKSPEDDPAWGWSHVMGAEFIDGNVLADCPEFKRALKHAARIALTSYAHDRKPFVPTGDTVVVTPELRALLSGGAS